MKNDFWKGNLKRRRDGKICPNCGNYVKPAFLVPYNSENQMIFESVDDTGELKEKDEHSDFDHYEIEVKTNFGDYREGQHDVVGYHCQKCDKTFLEHRYNLEWYKKIKELEERIAKLEKKL